MEQREWQWSNLKEHINLGYIKGIKKENGAIEEVLEI